MKYICIYYYLIFVFSPSSNNEDRPPPSEEQFFDSDAYNIYDRTMDETLFEPKLTKLQCTLLLALSRYIIRDNDIPEIVIRDYFFRDYRLNN